VSICTPFPFLSFSFLFPFFLLSFKTVTRNLSPGPNIYKKYEKKNHGAAVGVKCLPAVVLAHPDCALNLVFFVRHSTVQACPPRLLGYTSLRVNYFESRVFIENFPGLFESRVLIGNWNWVSKGFRTESRVFIDYPLFS